MKKLLATILVLCALCLCSCRSIVGTDVPDGALRFENDVVDYTFCYPESWKVTSENGISSVEFTNLAGRTAKISVMAFATDAPTVKEYWDAHKKELEKTFSDFTEVEVKDPELKLDDAPAMKFSYTVSGISEDVVYTFDQIICIRNGSVYLITFSALSTEYADNVAALTTVTDYFKFK